MAQTRLKQGQHDNKLQDKQKGQTKRTITKATTTINKDKNMTAQRTKQEPKRTNIRHVITKKTKRQTTGQIKTNK